MCPQAPAATGSINSAIYSKMNYASCSQYCRLVRMNSNTVIVVLFAVFAYSYSDVCNSRSYSSGIVCVCNATYCDTVPDLSVSAGKYQIYSTSQSNLGFNSETGSFVDGTGEATITVAVNRSNRYQTILGFGGAFTDSAGLNINLLKQEAQEKLLQSYFSDSGIQYSLCRVPIGGTDFSTRPYSYDDNDGDITLEHFELQPEDLSYKIPYIQQASVLTNNELKLFATPWTAPAWMKTNNDWAGTGFLKTEHYQLWADYILKFLDEYEKHNITYWGMTWQNEFINGFVPSFLSKINAMGWTPSQANQWIGENLGPTIRNSTHKDIKIILFDDSRETLLFLPFILENNLTMSYADGFAVHWYYNSLFPITALDFLKPYMDNMFLLPSEACNGDSGEDRGVLMGSWERGVKYITDILENLNYGASGWVDWNMVLDENGGPTYIDNIVDAPVIVNETLQEFYKQPTFYGLGHFSKFVRPGSVRIESSVSKGNDDLTAVAFLRPDNLTALIIFNNGPTTTTVQIVDNNLQSAAVEIQSNSINTILF